MGWMHELGEETFANKILEELEKMYTTNIVGKEYLYAYHMALNDVKKMIIKEKGEIG